MILELHHLIHKNFILEEFVSTTEGLTEDAIANIKDTADYLEEISQIFNSKPVEIKSYTDTEEMGRVVKFAIGGHPPASIDQRREWLNHLSDDEKDAFILEHKLDLPVPASEVVEKLKEYEYTPVPVQVDEFIISLKWEK